MCANKNGVRQVHVTGAATTIHLRLFGSTGSPRFYNFIKAQCKFHGGEDMTTRFNDKNITL
jgi:hypothetical protein